MARIRTIKPRFFRHEQLFEAEKETGLPLRLSFAGLFTVADREGRFRWEPRTIKLDILPYDEIDFAAVLDALAAHGFIVKYSAGGQTYGCIPTFNKHQVINAREARSEIPEYVEEMHAPVTHTTTPVQAQDESCGEGKGREKERNADTPSAHLIDLHPAEAEKQLFERGKQILKSSNSGGLIKNLVKAKGGNIALARAALETASTKADPREYLGAIVRGREHSDESRGRSW
jgi:hypothetical protein